MAKNRPGQPNNAAAVQGGSGSRGVISRWLEHKIWVGVAGILAALGVVIALVAYCDPPNSSAPPPANQISGNCNAQGSGNSVSCQN